VAGFPKVLAQDLVDNLVEQANQFNPDVVLEQSVEEVSTQEDGTLYLRSNTGDEHYTRAVIITAGVGAFHTRRLKVEGADLY
ncbi:hypothetical protein R0J90_21065, partial [Micrococcus sp. SIMBA_144]